MDHMTDIRGIIVEGCDCSGKSTLIKAMREALDDYGWDVMDIGHRPGNQFNRYLTLYANADRVIFDRGHFSEVVYGNLWREGNHFSPWERHFLDEFAFEKFIVIFTHAPCELLAKRYQERDFDQVITLDELDQVQSAFADTLVHPKTIIYDASTKENLTLVIEQVLAQLGRKNG